MPLKWCWLMGVKFVILQYLRNSVEGKQKYLKNLSRG